MPSFYRWNAETFLPHSYYKFGSLVTPALQSGKSWNVSLDAFDNRPRDRRFEGILAAPVQIARTAENTSIPGRSSAGGLSDERPA